MVCFSSKLSVKIYRNARRTIEQIKLGRFRMGWELKITTVQKLMISPEIFFQESGNDRALLSQRDISSESTKQKLDHLIKRLCLCLAYV